MAILTLFLRHKMEPLLHLQGQYFYHLKKKKNFETDNYLDTTKDLLAEAIVCQYNPTSIIALIKPNKEFFNVHIISCDEFRPYTVFPLKNTATFFTKSKFWMLRSIEGGVYQGRV